MYDALDRTHPLSSLAVPASPRDRTAQASLSQSPAHRAAGLLRWLIPSHALWRGSTDPAPLDQHTLSDIGLSRMDMLYSNPPK